jgi:hypothetical protein
MFNSIDDLYKEKARSYFLMTSLPQHISWETVLGLLDLTASLDEVISERWRNNAMIDVTEVEEFVERCQVTADRVHIYCKGFLEIVHNERNLVMHQRSNNPEMTPAQLKLLEFSQSHVAFTHRTALDFIFGSKLMEGHAFTASHRDLRIPLIQGVPGNFMFNDFLYEIFYDTLGHRAEGMFKSILKLAALMQDIPAVRDMVLDKLVHHLTKRDGIYPCTEIIEKLKDRSYPVNIEIGFLIYCLDHSKTYAPLIGYVISRLKASPIFPNGLHEAHLLFNLQLPHKGRYKDWARTPDLEIIPLLLDRLELAIPAHTADILEKYRFSDRQKATLSRRGYILSAETRAFFNSKQGLSINYEAAALDPLIGTDLAQTLSLIPRHV